MKRVFAYLFGLLIVYTTMGLTIVYGYWSIPSDTLRLALLCGVIGGIGGITYCFRGVYLNACVFRRWSLDWLPWYFIRPVVSFICGFVALVFLKAGLIVLEARQLEDSTNLAYYALAFIAGLNVDKFLEKLETVAEATWGIKMSRTATREEPASGE